MELTLPADHPLAEAITNGPAIDTWLVLKTPVSAPYSAFRSTFRAGVTKWTKTHDSVRVEFETWEDHIERRAQIAGL